MAKAKGSGTKGKCFHYGKTGHWKRNYPDFMSKKKTSGMIESLVSEVNFANGTLESRCVDSGATNHIYNSLQGFRETRRLSDGEIIVNLGSDAKAEAVLSGSYFFMFFRYIICTVFKAEFNFSF